MAGKRIHYTKSQTINMGNFESIRVEMGIETDCDFDLHNKKEFNVLINHIIELVENRLEEKVEEIQS